VQPGLLVLVGVAGLAVGLAASVAFRLSEREQRGVAAPDLPAIPPGVGAVLAVLTSQAVLVDASGHVVRASPAAHAYGLVRDGRLTSVELADMVVATRRDGEIRERELEMSRDRQGAAPMHISARVAPLGAELVLVLVQDRTESRRLEAIRRDFVANVSHELKTPVGALSLLAEAVADAADDPAAVRRFAGRMTTEAERLSSLIAELLELSRVQADDPLISPEPVEVDAVVRAAVDRAGAIAASHHVRVVTAGTPRLLVLGSWRQLVAALANLVDNAVAYSPDGSRVAVTTAADGDDVVVTVVDQGIGIPKAEQARIFERFYRIDPARARATGGTGLGLAIVKHVAAVHGGDVSVWSSEGAGSTFTLRLPRFRTGDDERLVNANHLESIVNDLEESAS
jgi:two-component system sensor histidine kinase SenX3